MSRNVIVTGAASGIGLACVDLLLAQGDRVCAVDLNPIPTDTLDAHARAQRMIEDILAHMGAIDKHGDMQPQAVLVIQHVTARRRITGKNIRQRLGHRGPCGGHRAAGGYMPQMGGEVYLGHHILPRPAWCRSR